MNRIISTKKYISLVDTLARMRMKSQANKLALSYLWWILEPLIFVALFYVLFSYVLHRGGDNYFSFMIVGKIVYLWFQKSVVTASTSLVANKGILAQRAIPKWVFPTSSVQECFYKSLISFLLLFIVLWFNGYIPTLYWIQIFPLILVSYYFIIGVSLIATILVSMARDFSNLINIGMLGLMFASGIFWDINSIQDETIRTAILNFNPLASIIYLYRQALLYNQVVDINLLINIFSYSTLFFVVGIVSLKRWNNQITRLIFP